MQTSNRRKKSNHVFQPIRNHWKIVCSIYSELPWPVYILSVCLYRYVVLRICTHIMRLFCALRNVVLSVAVFVCSRLPAHVLSNYEGWLRWLLFFLLYIFYCSSAFCSEKNLTKNPYEKRSFRSANRFFNRNRFSIRSYRSYTDTHTHRIWRVSKSDKRTKASIVFKTLQWTGSIGRGIFLWCRSSNRLY